MATLIKQNTAEGGTADAVVTTANSGGTSGDAFDAINIGTSAGNTLTYTASALRGNLSIRFVKASTTQCFCSWTWTGAQADVGWNIRFRYPSITPAFGEPILRFYSGAGYTPQIGAVTLQSGSGRKITASDTLTSASQDSAASLTFGGDYVAQIRWISGTSLTVNVYAAGSSTVVATSSVTASAASVNSMRVGLTGSSNSGITLDLDDIQVAYGGLPDRFDLAPSNPTVNAGATQNVAAGATVNLTAAGADTDGTIASYAWTWAYHPTTANIGTSTGITGAATSTASFTAGAVGSLYIAKCTVTDNSGLTGSANVEIRVPRSGSATSRPMPLTGTGNTWTSVGGAATDVGALGDESDTTYLESGTLSTTPTKRRVRLDPSTARSSGVLKLKLVTDAGTANCTIRLIEDVTVRQTWTQAITATLTEYSFTLSAPTVAAIADWGNLFIEVEAVL